MSAAITERLRSSFESGGAAQRQASGANRGELASRRRMRARRAGTAAGQVRLIAEHGRTPEETRACVHSCGLH
jgi:hypothetical protein